MKFALVVLIVALAAVANAATIYIADANEVQPLVRHVRHADPQRFGFGGFGASSSFANANSQSLGGGFGGFPGNGGGFGASASQASAGSQSFGGGFFNN